MHRWLVLLLSVAVSTLAWGEPVESTAPGRSVQSPLELQVELHRRGFSCGAIDGVFGDQTAGALRAFQRGAGLPDTGILDESTRARLPLTALALGAYRVTAADLAELHVVPDTWLGKSELSALAYESALEFVAERFHAHPNLIRDLNPTVNWPTISAGTKVIVPDVERVVVSGTPERIVITLAGHELEVRDADGRVIAHFPVSIAGMAEKRPSGDLHVTVAVLRPNYTFDPALFPESAEAASLGRKLILPPGPNNPVGLAWIGLDLPGYGIHGTPEPENVGRTESHGCFRLANWDVLTLATLVHAGMLVTVEP